MAPLGLVGTTMVITPQRIVLGLALLATVPLAIGAGIERSSDMERPPGAIEVRASQYAYEPGDTVRIAIVNAGDETISGTPSAFIVDQNMGILRRFEFGDFVVDLEPGKEVRAEWATAPPPPTLASCPSSSAGAYGEGPIHDCYPVGAGSQQGAEPVDEESVPLAAPTGDFLVVASLGPYADATTIRFV